MNLYPDELKHLKNADFFQQKIDGIFAFFEEKGIFIKTPPIMEYDKDALDFDIHVSIPLPE